MTEASSARIDSWNVGDSRSPNTTRMSAIDLGVVEEEEADVVIAPCRVASVCATSDGAVVAALVGGQGDDRRAKVVSRGGGSRMLL